MDEKKTIVPPYILCSFQINIFKSHFSQDKMAGNDDNSWCETNLKTRKTSVGSFFWKITGFEDQRDEFVGSEIVKSREFVVKDPDGKETKWMLECIPSYIGTNVRLHLISRNKFDVKVKIDVSITNNAGVKLKTRYDNTCSSTTLHKFRGTQTVEIFSKSFKDTLKAESLMPNGDLTFKCALTIFGPFEQTLGSPKSKEVPKAPTDVSLNVCENLGDFYLSKELSDVLIECQDQKFEAHQVILSASSPVFRRMFQADMKEKKSQLVEIKDLKRKPTVVSEMLKFIYTGSCVATEDNPDLDMVSDLLEASDEYQMVTLKTVCLSLLSSNLEVENSLKVKHKTALSNIVIILSFRAVFGPSWRHVWSPGVEKRGHEYCDQKHEQAHEDRGVEGV